MADGGIDQFRVDTDELAKHVALFFSTLKMRREVSNYFKYSYSHIEVCLSPCCLRGGAHQAWTLFNIQCKDRLAVPILPLCRLIWVVTQAFGLHVDLT